MSRISCGSGQTLPDRRALRPGRGRSCRSRSASRRTCSPRPGTSTSAACGCRPRCLWADAPNDRARPHARRHALVGGLLVPERCAAGAVPQLPLQVVRSSSRPTVGRQPSLLLGYAASRCSRLAPIRGRFERPAVDADDHDDHGRRTPEHRQVEAGRSPGAGRRDDQAERGDEEAQRGDQRVVRRVRQVDVAAWPSGLGAATSSTSAWTVSIESPRSCVDRACVAP